MRQPTPSPNITEKSPMNSHDNSNVALTKAEAAVLTLVDAGLSNQQIAARLAIGVWNSSLRPEGVSHYAFESVNETTSIVDGQGCTADSSGSRSAAALQSRAQ